MIDGNFNEAEWLDDELVIEVTGGKTTVYR